MSWVLHRPGFQQSILAASAINPYSPVKLVGTDQPLAIPAATSTDEIFGFNGVGTAGASGVNAAEMVTLYEEGNYVKAIAAASLGAHTDVGIASTNGALGPVVRASGVAGFRVGKSMTPAAAGEVFTCYVKPKVLGGVS